jgi:hypothetical protein
MVKRTSIFAVLILAGVVGPTMAQQTGPASNLQNKAGSGQEHQDREFGRIRLRRRTRKIRLCRSSARRAPSYGHVGCDNDSPQRPELGSWHQRRARQQERACPRKGNRWLSLSEPAAGTGSAERPWPAWQQERTSCEAVKRLAAARGRGRKTRPSRGRGEKLSDGARAGSCGYAWPRWRHGRCRQ